MNFKTLFLIRLAQIGGVVGAVGMGFGGLLCMQISIWLGLFMWIIAISLLALAFAAKSILFRDAYDRRTYHRSDNKADINWHNHYHH